VGQAAETLRPRSPLQGCSGPPNVRRLPIPRPGWGGTLDIGLAPCPSGRWGGGTTKRAAAESPSRVGRAVEHPAAADAVLREPTGGGGAAGEAQEVRRTRRGVGGADEVGLGRNGDGAAAYERRCAPANGRAWPRRPPRGPSKRGRRARQAPTDRAPRGGCSALRAERSLPLVCNDRFEGLCMHGGNYLY